MSTAAAYGAIKTQAGALISGLVPMLGMMIGLLIVLFLIGLVARYYLGSGRDRVGGVSLPGGSAGVLPSFPLGVDIAGSAVSDFRSSRKEAKQDRERAERDAQWLEDHARKVNGYDPEGGE